MNVTYSLRLTDTPIQYHLRHNWSIATLCGEISTVTQSSVLARRWKWIPQQDKCPYCDERGLDA